MEDVRHPFGVGGTEIPDPYAKGSVMAVLDEAQIPRSSSDGRRFLQAERVALLAGQRDRARAAKPEASRVALEPLHFHDIAHLTEWGHADTGVRP